MKLLIVPQKKLCQISHKCARNQNCRSIQTYSSRYFDLLFQLMPVYTCIYIADTWTLSTKIPTKSKSFWKQNIKTSCLHNIGGGGTERYSSCTGSETMEAIHDIV